MGWTPAHSPQQEQPVDTTGTVDPVGLPWEQQMAGMMAPGSEEQCLAGHPQVTGLQLAAAVQLSAVLLWYTEAEIIRHTSINYYYYRKLMSLFVIV